MRFTAGAIFGFAAAGALFALPAFALPAALAFGPPERGDVTYRFHYAGRTGTPIVETIHFVRDGDRVRLTLVAGAFTGSLATTRTPSGALEPGAADATEAARGRWATPLALYARLAALTSGADATPDGGSDPYTATPLSGDGAVAASLTRTRTGRSIDIVADGRGAIVANAGAVSHASPSAGGAAGGPSRGASRRGYHMERDATGGFVPVSTAPLDPGYETAHNGPYRGPGSVGGLGAPRSGGPPPASTTAAGRPRTVHLTITSHFSAGTFQSATVVETVTNAALGSSATTTWSVDRVDARR